MNSLLTNPCKGCEDRKPNCHASCEKYISWLNLYHKVKREEKVERVLGYSGWLEKNKHRGGYEKNTK